MPNDPAPELAKSLKRVNHACTRCKIKKVKCCGSTPCARCKADDAVCFYGIRGGNDKRMVSKTHVDRLQIEQRTLIAALNAMWNKYEKPLLPPDLAEEEPSLHAIVASTGVLKDELGAQDLFEEFDADGDDIFASPISSPVAGPVGGSSTSRRTSELEHEMDISPNPNEPNDFALLDADMTVPDPNANHWLDFVSFPQSPDAAGEIGATVGGFLPKQNLLQRRGSTWVPHCPMPSLSPETLTNSSADVSTTHERARES